MKTMFVMLQLAFGTWAVLVVGSFEAQATIIATDGFGYPDGTLSDLNGGTGAWETRWIGSGFNVVSGEVDGVNSLPANVNTVRRHFTNPLVTHRLFVSFDLRTAAAAIATDDYAVLSLFLGVNGNVVQVGKLPGSNELQVGSGGFVSSGVTLQTNQTYHIVAAYDVGHSLQSLWINPNGADFYDPSTGASSADAARNQPGLADATTLFWDTTRPGYILDDVVLSDTSDGAGIASVPEPSTVILGTLSLLIVCFPRTRKTRNGPSDNLSRGDAFGLSW